MPIKVGIYPKELMNPFKRLFSVLEQLYPVAFKPTRIRSLSEMNAVIVFQDDVSIKKTLADRGIRSFVVIKSGDSSTNSSLVKFGSTELLDPSLRSCTMVDTKAKGAPAISGNSSDIIMASSGDKPIWSRRHTHLEPMDLVSVVPQELGESEVLRDCLWAGRFIGLLPLIHFLKEISIKDTWVRPSTPACFILDDPNLHHQSYGYVHYPSMIEHAKKFNYHIAMATIPFDSWFINKGVARLFRKNYSRISLLVHGNNHTHQELAKNFTKTGSMALLSQALKRVNKFEEISKLAVSRVMVPPHGKCSETLINSLRVLEFQALCMSPFRMETIRKRPLCGWDPAEFVAGNFPIIPRYSLKDWIDYIPLIAFLDQPIILYGHHGDTARSLETFEKAANNINSLKNVRWLNLQDIASSNYTLFQEGSRLRIILFSRYICLDIPEGITEVVVESVPFSQVEGEKIQIKEHVSHNGIKRKIFSLKNLCQLANQDVMNSESTPIIKYLIKSLLIRE